MVLSFLNSHSIENYQDIREYCLTNGIISQCIDISYSGMKKKQKNMGPIIDNIMTQIVNKFGHLLWWAPYESMPESFQLKKILMIGIDVYHSKKTYREEEKIFRRRRSLASMIASFITMENGNIVYKHYNNVYEKEAGEEILQKDFEKQDLGDFIKDVLHEFGRPDIIIVYRDGVAESQIFHVVENEINQIVEKLKEENIEKDDVDIIYSVIQKRIHVRFIAQVGDECKNPPPGTVVDDGSISTSFYDETNSNLTYTESFYLIPTSCDLSTVKPVNYIVIRNDTIKNTIPLTDFQNFTFMMCMMYPNWTDAIKLPYPTMLAHKEAYTLGEKCKIQSPNIHPSLRKGSLFYL